MDPWSDRPRREAQTRAYQLLRTPPKGELKGIVLSDQQVGCYTHFWRGRTTVCTHEVCDACTAGRAPRWYGYLAIWSPTSHTTGILEFTEAALASVDAYFTTHGTLRAAKLIARRISHRANGRVVLDISEGNYAAATLPECPDVKSVLCKIWEIKETAAKAEERSTYDLSLVDEETRERKLRPRVPHETNGKH